MCTLLHLPFRYTICQVQLTLGSLGKVSLYLKLTNCTPQRFPLAPVSSPLLSRECLSRGQQRVSCNAEGDGPHYSWSLDRLPLNATRLLSGHSNASDVTLEPGLSGLITCSVRNNVSAAAANLALSVCDREWKTQRQKSTRDPWIHSPLIRHITVTWRL